jgi:hypothetical protein
MKKIMLINTNAFIKSIITCGIFSFMCACGGTKGGNNEAESFNPAYTQSDNQRIQLVDKMNMSLEDQENQSLYKEVLDLAKKIDSLPKESKVTSATDKAKIDLSNLIIELCALHEKREKDAGNASVEDDNRMQFLSSDIAIKLKNMAT